MHVPPVLSDGPRRLVGQREKQKGQALAEFGACAFLFVLLTIGLLDFAWDFVQIHMVTQATSVAARAASALSHPCGDSSAKLALAKQLVTAQTNGFATVDPNTGVTVTFTNETKGGAPCVAAGTSPQVTVHVTGTITDLFGLVHQGGTLNFTRTETFLDEGQS